MSNKLELERVTKSYGESVVLDQVDLVVAEHDVVCLIGSSGSGKSTLLKCVDLLLPIDAGLVRLDGADITAPDVNPDLVRQRMGIVFQSFNLFPHMSVIENITLGPRRVLGVDPSEARSSAMTLLTTPIACREVSNSGWRSSAHSPAVRNSCCSTRSRARSIPNWSPKCSGSCGI